MKRFALIWISVLLVIGMIPLSAAAEGLTVQVEEVAPYIEEHDLTAEAAIPEIGEAEIMASSAAEDPAAPEDGVPSGEENASAGEAGSDASDAREVGEADTAQPESEPEELQEYPSLRLGVGDKFRLSISGVKFKSSKTTVATVSRKGLVKAIKRGKAKITILSGGKEIGFCNIQVVKAPKKVTLSSKKLELTAGETATLEAKLSKTTASAIKWTSSNKKVATVDQDGVVTALKYGTAKITAKTYNGKKASCVINVKSAPVKVGSALVYSKKNSTYVRKGFTQTYTCIDLANAIPYVYYERGHFDDVVRNIEKHRSNIVVIANAYLGKGPIISNGAGFPSAKTATANRATLVIDMDGNVGYSPRKVSNSDLLSGRIDCINAATGEKTDDWKIYSAVCGFGYFYLNGKEEYTFTRPRVRRQRQFLGVKEDGTFCLLTMSKDGRNGKGWGWDGDDMVNIARKHNCVSAYNFDGGNSTATAWRFDTGARFTKDSASGGRSARGFLVFTSDNRPPYVR